jgi:hypothetical protein
MVSIQRYQARYQARAKLISVNVRCSSTRCFCALKPSCQNSRRRDGYFGHLGSQGQSGIGLDLESFKRTAGATGGPADTCKNPLELGNKGSIEGKPSSAASSTCLSHGLSSPRYARGARSKKLICLSACKDPTGSWGAEDLRER